jgi:3'-5' exoribonuclease
MRLGDLLPKEIKTLHKYVKDFEENSYVDGYYKVISKRMIKKMDGREFLIMTLGDRSGTFRVIDYYSGKKDNSSIKVGDIVKINGNVEVYQENFQIILSKDQKIEVLEKGSYDPSIFISEANIDRKELRKELSKLIDSVNDRTYKNLLLNIFNDKFMEKFLKSPAAIHIHHAYIGGLAEHTIEVAKLCDNACKVYQKIDRDLTITGALLHDVGKVEEFFVNDGIEKSDEGEFLGHIFMGAALVREEAKLIDLDKTKINKIVHIILSHHGEIEWGSPVTPRTKEAQVVFAMDNLSAKIQQFSEIMKRDNENGRNWSEYDRKLERRLWIKSEM